MVVVMVDVKLKMGIMKLVFKEEGGGICDGEVGR